VGARQDEQRAERRDAHESPRQHVGHVVDAGVIHRELAEMVHHEAHEEADRAVEVAMTHPIGVIEIETGRWEGNHLRLRSTTVNCTPTAKTVTGLHRDFEIDADVLSYSLRMATDGGEPRAHLTAELHRVIPES